MRTMRRGSPGEVLPYQRGQGVQRGGDVVEGVGPAPGHRTAAVRPGRAAPVLDDGHGETAPREERRERADVPPVVGGAPGAAVQHDDHGRGSVPAARRVEVDHVVGIVAIGRRDVQIEPGGWEKADLSSAAARAAATSSVMLQPLSDATWFDRTGQ
ncbi:hypothetical protein STENM223S_08815 [Streptomyces tendae]